MSELKLVGIERDKQIAELRGDRICHDFNLGGTCMYCAIEDTSNAVRDSVCPQKEIKPYSTDISCAMELAGEMVDAGVPLVIRAIKMDYTETGYRVYDDNSKDMVEAYKLASAISEIWLKWRTA